MLLGRFSRNFDRFSSKSVPAKHRKTRSRHVLERVFKDRKFRIFKDRKFWKPSKSIPGDSKWCQTTRNVTRMIFLLIWNHLESSEVDFEGFQIFRSPKIIIFWQIGAPLHVAANGYPQNPRGHKNALTRPIFGRFQKKFRIVTLEMPQKTW